MARRNQHDRDAGSAAPDPTADALVGDSQTASGTDAAFVNLLTSSQMSLQMYVRSLLPGDPASNDVAQHANAKIWEKRSEFEMGTNFKAWAFSVARFEVLNYRKRQARDARLTFSDELEETIANEWIATPDVVDQQHDALRQCLANLRPTDRKLLLHRYAESSTLGEYAKTVGRSVGGLKVTLHRLRTSLLACMRQKLSAGGAP